MQLIPRIVVGLALVAAAVPAEAGVVSPWTPGGTGTVSVTITDPGGSGANDYAYWGAGNQSVQYSGVVFSQSSTATDGPGFYTIGDPVTNNTNNTTVVTSEFAGSNDVNPNLTVTLPTATTSIAFYFGTNDGGPVTYALSNGDGSTLTSTLGSDYNIVNFFGITDTVPFTSVALTTTETTAFLNIGQVAYQVAAPEPAALALLLAGLAGLAVARRRSDQA